MIELLNKLILSRPKVILKFWGIGIKLKSDRVLIH